MNTKQLYAKVKDLFAQAELLKNKAGEENKPMSKEDRETYGKYIDEIKGIQDQITLMDEENRLKKANNEPADPLDVRGKTKKEAAVTMDNAIEKFVRKGASGMTPEERTMLNMGVDERSKKPFIEIDINPKKYGLHLDAEKRTSAVTNGEYVQATELYNQFAMTKKSMGQWFDATTELFTDTGRTIYLPGTNDAGNDGKQEAYGTDVIASSTDLAVLRGQLDQYPFSSTGLTVNWDDLEDESLDMSIWLYEPLMKRLMRAINAAATTGTGSSAPKGIAVTSVVGEIISASTTPTSTDLNGHLKLVDYDYHIGEKSGWMFNSNTMFAIAATVKSSTYNTEPLWAPSLAAGIPSTLYGYKYWINQSLDSIGANKKPILFGDFSYQFNRWVGPLRIVRLVERYAEKLQDGFFAYQRFDSDVSVVGTTYAPFKYMRNLGT